jgi:hypothetical protein
MRLESLRFADSYTTGDRGLKIVLGDRHASRGRSAPVLTNAPETSVRNIHPHREFLLMTLSDAERVAISRQNGKKSTGLKSAEERLALAGRHVPIQVPHVVTRLVGAQLREGQPDPGACPVVGPGELRDRVGTHPEP